MPGRENREQSMHRGRRATIGIGAGGAGDGVAADIGGIKIPGFGAREYQMTEAEKALPIEQQPSPYQHAGVWRTLFGDTSNARNDADRAQKQDIAGQIRVHQAAVESEAKKDAMTTEAHFQALVAGGMNPPEARQIAENAHIASLQRQGIANGLTQSQANNFNAEAESTKMLAPSRMRNLDAATKATEEQTLNSKSLLPSQIGLNWANAHHAHSAADLNDAQSVFYPTEANARIGNINAHTGALNRDADAWRSVGSGYQAPGSRNLTFPAQASPDVNKETVLHAPVPEAVRNAPINGRSADQPEPDGSGVVTPPLAAAAGAAEPLTPPIAQSTSPAGDALRTLINIIGKKLPGGSNPQAGTPQPNPYLSGRFTAGY